MVESFKQLLCLPTVKIRIKNIPLIYLTAYRWFFDRYCDLHASSCFLNRFSAFLYLMYSPHLPTLFIYHVYLLSKPTYLNLSTKYSGIIASKNKSFEELEFAYRWQLIEYDQVFMFTLICHPVSVASYKVVDYLLIKDLHSTILGLLLCIFKYFDIKP